VLYWRVRGIDVCGNQGTWSEARKLEIDLTPPNVPVLRSPWNNAWMSDTMALFIWNAVTKLSDGGKATPVRYVLQADTSASFASPLLKADTTAATQDSLFLAEGRYYWRVKAYDLAGNKGPFSDSLRFGVDTTAPADFDLKSPAEGAHVYSRGTLQWARRPMRSAG